MAFHSPSSVCHHQSDAGVYLGFSRLEDHRIAVDDLAERRHVDLDVLRPAEGQFRVAVGVVERRKLLQLLNLKL